MTAPSRSRATACAIVRGCGSFGWTSRYLAMTGAYEREPVEGHARPRPQPRGLPAPGRDQGDIEGYMAVQQHKPNATDLWL